MNKQSKNLITIGITAYNEGEYLLEAWNSVINQTDNRWEAIMVLDGGADKTTKKIFNSISHSSLKKIKLQGNKGPYSTRSIAINNANTDWYCQLDGDDLLSNSFIHTLLKSINDNLHADIMYGDIQYIRGTDKSIMRYNETHYDKLPFFLNGNFPIKKKIFLELNGYEQQLSYMAADRDFLIRCAINDKKFVYIPKEILYIVRKRENSVGAKRSASIAKRIKVTKYLHKQYAWYYIDKNYYEVFFIKDIMPMINYLIKEKKYIELLRTILILSYESKLFVFNYLLKWIKQR